MNQYPDITLGACLRRAVRCKCPQCGTGKVYKSYLKVADQCLVCGLDFSGHDSGDGAVVPVMLLIGGIVVGLALWLELSYEPAMWLHAVLWVPLTTILTLVALPVIKSLNVGLQHRYRSTSADS